MKSGPRAEVRALKRAVAEYEKKFLVPHLGVTALGSPKRAETLDVAAFVVLVHGALENFIEGLALWSLDRIVTGWTTKKRATRGTASMLLYQPAPEITKLQATSIFDNLRKELDTAKGSLSNAILKNNGITPEHIRMLFYRLGVDVPEDAVLTGSLESVVSMRHHWAHQYRHGAAAVVKSAQDAKTAVGDCLKFAERLAAEAVRAHP